MSFIAMKFFISLIFLSLCFYEQNAIKSIKTDELDRNINTYAKMYTNYESVDLRRNNRDIIFANKENAFERRLRYNDEYYFDAGNPDVHGEIVRPCQVYDTFCIRKFFAEHSHCKISGRKVPEPLFRAQSNFNYPHVNMSLSQITADYSGINNAKIEEFYINKATDNLVIAFGFDAVSKFSNNTIVKYYLRGREPIVTNDFTGITYLKLTVTVIIPHLDNLRLDKAEISTYANTPLFPFELGPRLGVSSDPEVPIMYAAFLATVEVAYQEEIFTQGAFFGANFLQYNICDFGIKVL